LVQSSSNFVKMFVLILSRSSLIMGWVESNKRSLGQILEKSCLSLSRGHIFGPIFLKYSQKVCLDDISVKLIMGWVGSESRSLGQIFEKSCLYSRGHMFCPIFLKLNQNVCFDDISLKINYGLGLVKK